MDGAGGVVKAPEGGPGFVGGTSGLSTVVSSPLTWLTLRAKLSGG